METHIHLNTREAIPNVPFTPTIKLTHRLGDKVLVSFVAIIGIVGFSFIITQISNDHTCASIEQYQVQPYKKVQNTGTYNTTQLSLDPSQNSAKPILASAKT